MDTEFGASESKTKKKKEEKKSWTKFWGQAEGIQPYPVAQKQNHIYWNFLPNLNQIQIGFQRMRAFNSEQLNILFFI